ARAQLLILSREGGRGDSFGWALVGELVGRPALPSTSDPLGLSSASGVPAPPPVGELEEDHRSGSVWFQRDRWGGVHDHVPVSF
uniref:Uncharacterized protein n=4 Tax=Aegilops tauschii subsp. strangulata TaxID=200361 RepID=A0A453CBJ9_AEGTS